MEFDFLQNLATGFGAAASLTNIGLALIGVLPGIAPINQLLKGGST